MRTLRAALASTTPPRSTPRLYGLAVFGNGRPLLPYYTIAPAPDAVACMFARRRSATCRSDSCLDALTVLHASFAASYRNARAERTTASAWARRSCRVSRSPTLARCRWSSAPSLRRRCRRRPAPSRGQPAPGRSQRQDDREPIPGTRIPWEVDPGVRRASVRDEGLVHAEVVAPRPPPTCHVSTIETSRAGRSMTGRPLRLAPSSSLARSRSPPGTRRRAGAMRRQYRILRLRSTRPTLVTDSVSYSVMWTFPGWMLPEWHTGTLPSRRRAAGLADGGRSRAPFADGCPPQLFENWQDLTADQLNSLRDYPGRSPDALLGWISSAVQALSTPGPASRRDTQYKVVIRLRQFQVGRSGAKLEGQVASARAVLLASGLLGAQGAFPCGGHLVCVATTTNRAKFARLKSSAL